MLATLHEWSIEHISDVFEAKSEDECLRAIDHTFSQHIEFMSNGKQLCRADLQKFVLSMVMGSCFDGVLGGYYIISNVRKTSPSGAPVAGRFSRHKFINVVIESESDDYAIDSRRIVRLNLTATDKPQ
ncbi:hypothetical protein BC629DRAFT_1582515 [Irpex lacteus]|nr:hypothetical protein BC629DRAFT_1582515 [Irpex lacteus]